MSANSRSAGFQVDEGRPDRNAARAPRRGLFQPLGRDYWPSHVGFPILRGALALVAAPLALAAALGAVAGVVALFDPTMDASAIAYALDTFGVMAFAFIGPEFWPAVLAFLALWSLRMRSRGAFVAAALVTGALGSAIAALRLDALSGAVTLAIVLLHLAYLQLVAAFAGVGAAPAPSDDD